MPSSFSSAQYLELAKGWNDWSQSLLKFQQGHAGDSGFDNEKVAAWIYQANAISSLCTDEELTVTLNDAFDAYTRLLNITEQATKNSKYLAAQVQTWDKLAFVVDKMTIVVTALKGGGLLMTPFFKVLDEVAKAYSNNPSSDATAKALPSNG